MNLVLIISIVYAIVVVGLVTMLERPAKNRQRLTGRGGDFEG